MDDEPRQAGNNTANWNGRDYEGGKVPNGPYILTFEDGSHFKKKVVVVLNK